jgi:hypothetical protein
MASGKIYFLIVEFRFSLGDILLLKIPVGVLRRYCCASHTLHICPLRGSTLSLSSCPDPPLPNIHLSYSCLRSLTILACLKSLLKKLAPPQKPEESQEKIGLRVKKPQLL